MKKCLLVFGLLAGIAQAQNVQNSIEAPNFENEFQEDDGTIPDSEDLGDDDLTFRRYVGVPSGYVYNPDLGTTHDYCSYSPDSYLKANFRGPCARHDLCYDSPTDKKKCDAQLLSDMYANCDDAYGTFNPIRQTCHSVAHGYFVAVVAHH